MTERESSELAQGSIGQQAWTRWRRVGLVAVAMLVVAGILYVARGALFPFLISIVLAQLLYPAVVFVEKRMPGHNRAPDAARIVSILLIYFAFAGIVAGILYLTIPPLFAEAQELARTFPDLYERSRSSVESWSHDITERIPVEVRTQLEEAVAGGGNVLADAAQGIIERTVSGVSNAVTVVIGLAVVPFFLFYVLKDREKVVGGLYPMLSPSGRKHTRNVILMVNQVVGSYVRAQLLSATIVGLLVFVGFDHSRHRIRRHPGAGRRAVRPNTDHWPPAWSGAGTARHARELAPAGDLGRPRLRSRSVDREQLDCAAHTGKRRPPQPRDHNGYAGSR